MELANFFETGGLGARRAGRRKQAGFDSSRPSARGPRRPDARSKGPARAASKYGRTSESSAGRRAKNSSTAALAARFFFAGRRFNRGPLAADRPFLPPFEGPLDGRPAKRQGPDFPRGVGPAGTEGKRLLDPFENGFQGEAGRFPGRDQADVGRRKRKRRPAKRNEAVGDRPVIPLVFHRSTARSFCRS